MLNASAAEENNFPLAGAHLTNHVIANFEAPSQLTAESLGKTGAEYLVDVLSPASDSPTLVPGAHLTLVDDEVVPTGDERLRWRIWKVDKSNPRPVP